MINHSRWGKICRGIAFSGYPRVMGHRIVLKRCRSCSCPSFWLAPAHEKVKNRIRRERHRFCPPSAPKLSPPKKSHQFLSPHQYSVPQLLKSNFILRNYLNQTLFHPQDPHAMQVTQGAVFRQSPNSNWQSHTTRWSSSIIFWWPFEFNFLEQAAFFESMHGQLS